MLYRESLSDGCQAWHFRNANNESEAGAEIYSRLLLFFKHVDELINSRLVASEDESHLLLRSHLTMEDLESEEFKVHDPCVAWLNGNNPPFSLAYYSWVTQCPTLMISPETEPQVRRPCNRLFLLWILSRRCNNTRPSSLNCLNPVRERSGCSQQGRTRPVVQPQQQPHHGSPGQQLPGEYF